MDRFQTITCICPHCGLPNRLEPTMAADRSRQSAADAFVGWKCNGCGSVTTRDVLLGMTLNEKLQVPRNHDVVLAFSNLN